AILDVFVMLALFFPSRSRHTRFSRDWSSTCALPIFFLGAEFTQVYGRLRGSRVAESALLAEPEMTRAPATVETEEGVIMPQAIIDAHGEGTTEDAVAEPSPPADAPPGRVRRAGRATVAAVASVAAAMAVIVAVSIYSLVREPFRRE